MSEEPQGSGAKGFFVSALASPASGAFPLSVSFSVTIVGGTGPYTFAWTFGDGGTSTSANPTKIYTVNGTFTATVVVTDSTGVSKSSVTTVTALTGVATLGTGLLLTDTQTTAESVGPYNGGPGFTEPAGTLTESITVTNP